MRYYAVHAVRFSNNPTPPLYRCPPDCSGFKLTRELGKWFLHRDITGDRCGLGGVSKA
jgi:hypothetical protein